MSDLSKYRVYDAEITRMRNEYSQLTVDGIEDRNGLKIVHEARMDVKSKRVAVEKLRKTLKADALEYGRAVDAEAKRITQLLEPIEAHLEAEEFKVEREKQRIKEAEEARIAAEKAEAERIERHRLAEELRKQQEEIAEQRKALEADRARLAEENRKVEETRRAVEIEQAKQESAERARIETEKRIERERQDELTRLELAEQRRIQAEAELPYAQKLLAIAANLESIAVPEGSETIYVVAALKAAATKIRELANGIINSSLFDD